MQLVVRMQQSGLCFSSVFSFNTVCAWKIFHGIFAELAFLLNASVSISQYFVKQSSPATSGQMSPIKIWRKRREDTQQRAAGIKPVETAEDLVCGWGTCSWATSVSRCEHPYKNAELKLLRPFYITLNYMILEDFLNSFPCKYVVCSCWCISSMWWTEVLCRTVTDCSTAGTSWKPIRCFHRLKQWNRRHIQHFHDNTSLYIFH